MSNQNEHSDQLFDELSKNKKKKKHKIIRTVIIIILVIVIAGFAAVSMLRRRVEEEFANNMAEVKSFAVTRDTISTTVSGSGMLTQVDLESLSVPAGVELTDIIVENGDVVAQGDVLATVEMATVLSAMSDVQAQLDELDEQIADAKGDKVSSYIQAGVAGRVKLLYAEAGTDVASCMAEHGALAVLSLDGYMAVEIETDALSKGDSVTVTRTDGTEISGTVESAAGGKAVILVTDNGPEYDEEVSVATEDGSTICSGKLYIHSPLAVTGYAGTVSKVYKNENTQVYASTNLFYLTDTETSASYDALLRSRGDLEQTLLELLTIYHDGAVLSPMDGQISSIDYTEETDTTTEAAETSLLTLYPNEKMSVAIGIDETDILSLEEGQEAEITVSSVGEDVYTGTVFEISKEATTSSGVTQYSAVVELAKAEGMLPGMTAEVDVKIQGVDNALVIPVAALHQTSAISFVYTTYDEETQQYGGRVEVTTGMQNSSYVEITSGLSEGDTVYYTEEENFSFGFGNMGGMGGFGGAAAMPSGDFSSGEMPDMSNMPSRGGSSDRGGMSDRGQMPGGMGG